MVLSTLFYILGIAGLGGWEVFAILVMFFILFGAKKIPDLARGIGRGIREFKDSSGHAKGEIEESIKDEKK